MIDILLILLKPALLYVEGKQKRYILHAIVAGIVDVIIAHTTWTILFGKPHKNEWTVSHTLERLCKDTTHPDREWFIQTALKINRISPTGDHIKAVLERG